MSEHAWLKDGEAPETPEILEEEMAAIPPGTVINKDNLHLAARALGALDSRVAMIEKYRADEVGRINEFCNQRINRYTERIAYLLDSVKLAMESGGARKAEFPGLGKFSFVKGREAVDDSTYGDMSTEEQSKVQAEWPGLFRTTVKVAPDKKAILSWIKESGEMPPGFGIRPATEKFTFKKDW